MVQIPSLAETPEAIRQEAEPALADDPLLAYFRAQEWQRREPDDPAAAQLVQQAKDKLAGPPSAGDPGRFRPGAAGREPGRRPHVHPRPAAGTTPTTRTCAAGPARCCWRWRRLRRRENNMDEARDALRLGRAMFPQDPTWQARLKLLEAIQAMPKADRAPWIQLLG